jgi:hypothetical protein
MAVGKRSLQPFHPGTQEKFALRRLAGSPHRGAGSLAKQGTKAEGRMAAGQTANLTITVRKSNARGLCVVGVVSTIGDRSYMWPVAVIMR